MQHPGLRAQLLWNDVTDALRGEVSDTSYKNYIHSSLGMDIIDGSSLLVSVPHDLSKAKFEQQYKPMVIEILASIAPEIEKIIFIARKEDDENDEPAVAAQKPSFAESPNLSSSKSKKQQNTIILNPNYTLDRFVIGNSNRHAVSAALGVIDSPGYAYNPLFLYSNVGLGKTHLMHAIGHKIQQQHPHFKVLYISSETFVNELIESIQKRTSEEFRNKYRSIDVLLIDDIQFLSGKEKTQEEFFHTFNALKELNKQIVVSSDRPPGEIAVLEDRISSRFKSGLVVDISPPDLETRIAILRNKAERETLEVPHDVIVYIADNISKNIRELEGALTRVLAITSMTGEKLTLSSAEEALKDIIKQPKQRIVTVDFIKAVISEEFKVKQSDLESTKRPRNIAHPRQIAMFLSRELTNESLPSIGNYFNRDHSTVIHAYEKVHSDIQNNKSLADSIKRLIDKIQNS